jgi:tetratricopeptide (TPR) repeat protein
VSAGPTVRVCLMENHDEAFYIWRDAGAKQRVLVHIDAHHDMWWIEDKATITIANFICPALKQDLVREVVWVAPDETFASAKSRKPLLTHLSGILKEYPVTSRSLVMEGDRIAASVLGKNLTVCPLRSMRAFSESVLLDIDVDYLLIPRVSYGESDRHAPLPWCWPGELVRQLGGISSDLVTVVYSVQGGYTPLQWKYLGDELVMRLKNSPADSLEGMDRMREGAEAELRGETTQSESQYRRAMDLLPGSAAPPHRLARLLVGAGRPEEGRGFYRQALELDGSYKGPYSSTGFHQIGSRQFDAAQKEFLYIQALDPQDTYAELGLGLIAKQRKQWAEAERHLRAALAGNDCLVDAQHALGQVLVKLGKEQEAVTALERALKMGLMGYRSLTGGPILTHAREDQILDPWHYDTHARLAALYERSGATAKAITALLISLASGFDGVGMRLRLARLYAKQRHWRKSAGEIWQALKVSPRGASRGYRRLRRRLKGRFRAASMQ